MRKNVTGLLFAGVSALIVSASASQASAHLCVDEPVSRVGQSCTVGSAQKAWPCGVAGRSKNVTTYRPGQTIEIKLRNTIAHRDSWYRVSFNPSGDTFDDPKSFQDRNGKLPTTLVEGVPMTDGRDQVLKVTLPGVECDKCTLQVMQVMGDKVARGFGGKQPGTTQGDDLYYSCSDLVLKGEPAGGGVDAGAAAPSGSTGTTSGDAGTSEPLALALGDEPDGSVEEMSEGCSLTSNRSDASAAALLLVGFGVLIGRVRRQRRRG
jgi:hypothetical protein